MLQHISDRVCSGINQDGKGTEPVSESDKDLGVCGRLMCCLTNEEETYEVLNSQLPSVGDNVTTSDGLTGTVHSLSVLRRLVKVIVNLENDEKEIREYKADDLKFRPRRKKQKVSKEEQKKLAALERMEKKEGAPKLDDK